MISVPIGFTKSLNRIRSSVGIPGHVKAMSNNAKVNKIDYVEFPAPSVPALRANKDFYRQVFGWSWKDWGEEYADTQDSGIASGLASNLAHRPSKPLVVLYTDQLEATKEKIVQAGGMVSKEITAFPGGRRFHYIDPAGNELAVWSDK